MVKKPADDVTPPSQLLVTKMALPDAARDATVGDGREHRRSPATLKVMKR